MRLEWIVYYLLKGESVVMSLLMSMSIYKMMAWVGKNMQDKRLILNWSQQTLSARSGVSYGTVKKFERTGEISLKSLLSIALVLEEIDFLEPLLLTSRLVEKKGRKRGRK